GLFAIALVLSLEWARPFSSSRETREYGMSFLGLGWTFHVVPILVGVGKTCIPRYGIMCEEGLMCADRHEVLVALGCTTRSNVVACFMGHVCYRACFADDECWEGEVCYGILGSGQSVGICHFPACPTC